MYAAAGPPTGSPREPPGLEALEREARVLRPVLPCERASILRERAAVVVDRLLVQVARGRGALDVTMGDALAALSEGDRTLRLGFSGLADYARERLGIAGRTALELAQLARALRDRPLLLAAVRAGEVTARKARAILPVARGEAEASWVARARVETVRALESAVRVARAAGGGAPDAEDARGVAEEVWRRLSVPVTEEAKRTVEEALELAGKLLGATSTPWERLEALCQELLGGAVVRGEIAPAEEEGSAPAVPDPGSPHQALRVLREDELAWGLLARAEPVAAPELAALDGTAPGDRAFALDAELCALAGMRLRWDAVVGHLAMLLQSLGLWRDMGFSSFAHYCAERLGLSPRTVEQRAALERRLYEMPALREALASGRVSYEKARLVARAAHAHWAPDEARIGHWLARAEACTCIALRREVDADADRRAAQMCAHPTLVLRAPRHAEELLQEAYAAVRAAEGRWLSPGECLERLARHFIATWKDELRTRRTPPHRALARDRGLCQVPGCSRAAVHAHHVLFRSAGGEDTPDNLVALCAGHHLHGVHRGFIRVRGRAPAALTWEMGCRAGRTSLLVVRPSPLDSALCNG